MDENFCTVDGEHFKAIPRSDCKGCVGEFDAPECLFRCGLLGPCSADERTDRTPVIWVVDPYPPQVEACHGWPPSGDDSEEHY